MRIFVAPDKVEEIANSLAAKTFVEEVSYDKPLIALLNDNVKRIGFWIVVASAVFTLIAVLLINSSIRLSIYSKRFIIKTMQMVGATKKFIRKPFISTNIKLGFFGGLLAVLAMGVVLYYVNRAFPELQLFTDGLLLGGLFLGILVLGLLIAWVSTYFCHPTFPEFTNR